MRVAGIGQESRKGASLERAFSTLVLSEEVDRDPATGKQTTPLGRGQLQCIADLNKG